MNYDISEEEVRAKGKIIATTVFIVIGVFVIFIIIGIISIKMFFNNLTKQQYYVLDVNSNNKDKVISLLENEEFEYCESIYKIEYLQQFPDGKSAKIYCENEEDIKFEIYDNKVNELAKYIYENGIDEKR